jgi:hypothetical protein
MSKKLYKEDDWNSWTKKSIGISFQSNEKAIGDGEYKIGAEFDQKPLGQNFSYDLDIFEEKWEIKKMDSDNSFRLGVEIVTCYTPIIGNVIRILEKILSIRDHITNTDAGTIVKDCIDKIETISGSSKTALLDGLRKNEVSESNLGKANSIIEVLKTILIKDEKEIKLYSSIDGKEYGYDIIDAYKKISLERVSIKDKIKIFGDENLYNRVLVTNEIMNDIKTFENTTLHEELNKIIRNIFKDVKLVLVHEEKGFRPISNLDNIFCNRITSGSPRCKIR